MKRADYFFTVFLSVMLVLVTYGFINYFRIMLSLVVVSCVVNFVVFVVKTRIKKPVANANTGAAPIDFYNNGKNVTYYDLHYSNEQQQKMANAK